MMHLTQEELENIVSLYIDGELDITESKNLEEYLSSHPVVAREVDMMRAAKHALTSKAKIPSNEWFWRTLSQRLESIEAKSQKTFFVMRPIFAFSSIAMFTLAVVGMIYVKDSAIFHQFFFEKKNQVEQMYRNNIMTGGILPLFTNLNKDDILNFALFGSIAIDSSRNTSLQVKNTENDGSQIQIVRNDIVPGQSVTLNDFAAEIGISSIQQSIVDSILGSYKETLQSSVLVSENDEIAIHAELVNLNRAMVSTIAACLELPQRIRFQKYLDVKKAPYTVVALNSPKIAPHVIFNTISKISHGNNYVVISPDTVEIAHMNINVDSIHEVARRLGMKSRNLQTERMVAELTERQRRLEENFVGRGQNRVRVHSFDGSFQIQFEHSTRNSASEFEMVGMVKPRMQTSYIPNAVFNHVTVIGDSAFSFEFPADDQTVRVFQRLPNGEFRFEMIDSLVHNPKMKVMFKSPSKKRDFDRTIREMQNRERSLIDLDSLLRESDAHIDAVPPKPKKSRDTVDTGIIL